MPGEKPPQSARDQFRAKLDRYAKVLTDKYGPDWKSQRFFRFWNLERLRHQPGFTLERAKAADPEAEEILALLAMMNQGPPPPPPTPEPAAAALGRPGSKPIDVSGDWREAA